MDIQLNFINRSNDSSNDLCIVIIQKNVVTDFDAAAWKVIQYCGQGDNHPFTFPMEMYFSVTDSFGNYLPRLPAEPGQLFAYSYTPRGDEELSRVGPATSPSEFQVRNGLTKGSINASIYRSGRLLATKTSMPRQTARFEFSPTIWIGVASRVTHEGETLISDRLSEINTELSLLGIASADIVLTGGGPGSASTPFRFSLENVVLA